MKLILVDGVNSHKDGNCKADIQQFIEDMSNEYPYLKYICCQERINVQNPDFSKPIYFFNYSSLESAFQKIEQNINKINKLKKQNQALQEKVESKQVDNGEQEIYQSLYEETQEKLSQKIIEFEQLQTQYSALENQQSEILKKTQQNSVGICQLCLSGNQKLDKIKQDNLKLTQNLTNEQNKNNKLQQELRELKNVIQELELRHRDELQQQMNNNNLKYIQDLNSIQTVCKQCFTKQITIEELDNKLKLNEQYQNNRAQESEKRIRLKEDEINELKKQLSQNKLIKCQCLEKDSKIKQLQDNLSDLQYKLERADKDLNKLKQDYQNTKFDLQNQNERNTTQQRKLAELSENLKQQQQNNREQQEVIQKANKEQQKCYEQLLEYEQKFQQMIQEKIEVDKQLSQQLQNLTIEGQDITISALKKYIQNQDRNYHQQTQEYVKFRDDFKAQMSQLTKQAIKSSIFINQQKYQQ